MVNLLFVVQVDPVFGAIPIFLGKRGPTRQLRRCHPERCRWKHFSSSREICITTQILRIQFREKELGKRRLLECSEIVGGDRLGNIESMAGGVWYVNRKETRWGQGDIVVEQRSEGCDKS